MAVLYCENFNEVTLSRSTSAAEELTSLLNLKSALRLSRVSRFTPPDLAARTNELTLLLQCSTFLLPHRNRLCACLGSPISCQENAVALLGLPIWQLAHSHKPRSAMVQEKSQRNYIVCGLPHVNLAIILTIIFIASNIITRSSQELNRFLCVQIPLVSFGQRHVPSCVVQVDWKSRRRSSGR